MACLKSPDVLMIDLFENKVSKEVFNFNFIDVEKKKIVDSLNIINKSGRCYLQAVNFNDRVFLVQREWLP
jgi:hypothetical protein